MVQELQNAEHDPRSYLASNCLKSFHGHCENSNQFATNYIVVFIFIFCIKKQKSENQKKNGKKRKIPIMAKNEESPEHGSLGSPVKRPNEPSIGIDSGEG
ncbi:hypothetical protein PanWU01x14_308420 [Parasponia andersonii]|uniref:Uncharacterized protein n=1 Tax=Parasponia andersonii TaxID=3476 RepID=A0A2P5AR21_PARAD|nr:hypothetical protein PanWU01x14_308420 [Parasponia andersonii]